MTKTKEAIQLVEKVSEKRYGKWERVRVTSSVRVKGKGQG
jgi:hypothetical protein